MKIYQQDIPGKQAKENIKAGVKRYLAKLTESQRQELLGIAGNKAYTNGESWQKHLRGWQGIGKQESRLKYAQLYKIPELGTDVIDDAYHSPKQITGIFKTRKLDNSRFDIRISNNVNLKPKMLAELEKQLNQAIRLMKIKNLDKFPQIIVGTELDLVGALGAYIAKENKLYINSYILDKSMYKNYILLEKGHLAEYRIATLIHELYHWKDAVKYSHKYGKITNQKHYTEAISKYHKPNVDKLIAKGYNIDEISDYAYVMYGKERYDEVMTEYRTLLLLEGGIRNANQNHA